MELDRLLRLIGRRWWIVLIVAILGGAIGYGSAALQTPRYKAEATVLFLDHTRENGSEDLLRRMPTFAALTGTGAILDRAAQRLNYPGGAKALRANTTAANPENTLVLTIAVTDVRPARAAEAADAVADSFSAENDQGIGLGDRTSSTVVQRAELPGAPESPLVAMFLAIGVVAGAVLGIIALMIETAFRNGRHTVTAERSVRM
ncbi:YveK family protein [Sciscionella sediminilitoris]|uniref:YveK family protein n=1 Tax=Sciscionella sediminilitoris TaxID=1445613 RepID=UPI0004DF5F98|nr:Wzz/FepE/Etk N-terminal domain-containing protein [Sciscionella sp. SE31]